MPLRAPLPQQEALELPGFRARQGVDELDLPGILVGRDVRLDELLELADRLDARLCSRSEDDEGLDEMAALLVRQADHAALLHLGMVEQHALDLRTGDVVPRG